MTSRVVLLVTSPRLPAGLLTAASWDLVRTHPVLAAAESDQTAALRAAGADVRLVEPTAEAVLAAADPTVVWLAGPGGDPDLARELGLRLALQPRLVSPGGDPWKRQQTHETLAHFLLEEAYEAYDAIVAGDRAALREELGDVLLQVVLHARMAEDGPDDDSDGSGRWSIDDVAGDLVDKLVRRNPHVFGTTTVDSVQAIVDNWERIKKAEKARGSVMDGIALSQPALALATKVLSRAQRTGIAAPDPAPPSTMDNEASLGAGLLAIVAAARAHGLDAEGALRKAALAYADAIRAVERQTGR